ncbi:ASIC1 protein, partial [Polypterus senegalus]
MVDETVMEVLKDKANFLNFKPRSFNMLEFYDRAGHDIRDMLLSCRFRGSVCSAEDFKESTTGTIPSLGHEKAAALVCLGATGTELRSSSLWEDMATARGRLDSYGTLDGSTSATPREVASARGAILRSWLQRHSPALSRDSFAIRAAVSHSVTGITLSQINGYDSRELVGSEEEGEEGRQENGRATSAAPEAPVMI